MQSRRPPDRRAVRRVSVVVASVAALVLVPGTTAPVASAQPSPSKQDPGTVQLTGLDNTSHTVTLVTGDRIKLTAKGGGRYAIDQAPVAGGGRSAMLYIQRTPDGVFALPQDAMPAIQSGRLDRQLFNVSYLAENGYADDKANQTPVIVQYPKATGDAQVKAAATAIPASAPGRVLDSIHGAALSVPKSGTGTFWDAVRAVPPKSGVTTLATPGPLRGGIAKVWLDRKFKVDLDQSVPMIGAPQAWANGHDGAGVKVAVLDTGIDETHPDLKGKVAESKSFVPNVATAKDGHGHGTHVASTIVGSGAASGGKYKGVAPGAQLEVGKILNDGGSGDSSWIIAGMEWAAASGAKVVSMSIGGPSDGTDPVTQAVNDLSANGGPLFVIAAGNAGPTAQTVESPGLADAALTVAAVDKQDRLAEFSSRGPRFDGGLKPDIAAPGVGITAARASGTSMGTPVDDSYTTADGTSMATPHVAGAAAILAQHHPDWSGQRIKAALMSTSKDDGFAAYEQGAGRVDVARADSQQVFAETSGADFGSITDDTKALTRQVTYRNDSGRPVTLTLNAALRDSTGATVDGRLSVAETTLTVPAGGTASTAVNFDPSGLGFGRYGGVITATADGVALRTPVGAVREAPTATLTVHTIDRDGKPHTPWAQDIVDVDGDQGLVGTPTVTEPGVVVTRIPQGTVSLTQLIAWVDGDSRLNHAFLFQPQLTIAGDTDITLDARQASQVRFTTPEPADPLNNTADASYMRTVSNDAAYQGTLWLIPQNGGPWARVWALPTERVTKGKFRFVSNWELGRSEVELSIHGGKPLPLHAVAPQHLGLFTTEQTEDSFPDFRQFHGTQNLPVADVGTAPPEEIARRTDLRGKLVLLEAGAIETILGRACGARIEQIGAIRDAGAAGVAIFPTKDSGCPIPATLSQAPFTGPLKPIGIPDVFLSTKEGLAVRDRLASGPFTIQVTGHDTSPYSYGLKPYEEGRVPHSLHYTFSDQQLAQVDMDLHAAKNEMVYTWSGAFKQDEFVNLAATPGQSGLATGPVTHRTWIGPLSSDVIREAGVATSTDRIYWRNEVFDQPIRTRQQWLRTPVTPGPGTASANVYAVTDPKTPPPTTRGADLTCVLCLHGNVLWNLFRGATGVGDDRDFNGRYIDKLLSGDAGLSVHLYRDGQEIPTSPLAGWPASLPRYELLDGPSTYTMTATDSGTDVEWTFHSPPPTDLRQTGFWCNEWLVSGDLSPCRPEPAVFVSYDLGKDQAMDNTVAAGRAHKFTVQAYHSPVTSGSMPPIAGLKLWASTDDGATWTPVPVKAGTDGVYTATTNYPAYNATTGAVSLKVEAWDADGNRIEQTTKRAFDLRP
jgi:subtilisin family serine protease